MKWVFSKNASHSCFSEYCKYWIIMFVMVYFKKYIVLVFFLLFHCSLINIKKLFSERLYYEQNNLGSAISDRANKGRHN